MAYINQEMKSKIAPAVKAVLKKHGVKGSLSIRDQRSLVLTVTSGKIDFFDGAPNERKYHDVNVYHVSTYFQGDSNKFLTEVLEAMNKGNWNRSESQFDYFDVGWYNRISIGRWNKPYELV